MHNFGTGQVVAVKIVGYGGKIYTVNILQQLSGRVAGTDTGHIQAGTNVAVAFPSLPRGSYVAVLMIDGLITETWSFAVGS